METSVEAAELLAPPRPEEAELDGGADSASSGSFDPMEEFSRRLQVILRTHGSADVLLDKAVAEDAEADKTKEEAKVDAGTDVSLIKQSLSNAASPEEKLDELVQKYAQQAALRRREEQRASSLQQKLHVLLEERRGSVAARSKLEALCRDLQAHYSTLREETLRRCREDEQKRNDITNHFQETLTEIQAQIEQHSGRNDKLRQENANLTDKLESLMNQYERREESLEKINKHRDLQHKLTEAKLQQANALLAEAEEKHKREKEYLLREAIDKTKKCFAMKEQELDMKKKLTLYAQKFDEFQETLAKSNEIYVRFKKEMDNMTEKMKKVEKEANLWKSRFENCNKTLIDMIEERTEKGKEYDQFVLKIQKLEKLCHALQGERRGLYAKIREVRQANASIPSKLSEISDEAAIPEIEGLQELQEEDPVLMASVARLREEQAKLQEFAAALLAAPESNEEKEGKDEADAEEDVVVSAIAQFKTKTAVKEDPVPAASQLEKRQGEVQDPPVVLPEATEPTDHAASQEASRAQTQIQDGEVEAKRDEDVRHPGAPSSEPSEVDPEIVKVYPEPSNVYPEIVKVYPEPSNVDPEIVKVYPEPFNVDPEIVKVYPEPFNVDPELVKVDPEPFNVDPELVKVDPELVKVDPELVKVDPELVKVDPKLVKVDPELVKVDPELVKVDPEPSNVHPELVKVDPEPEALKTKSLEETKEAKPVLPVEDVQVQKQPLSGPEPVPGRSNGPSEGSTKAAASSTKQVLKKRKKRNSKAAS